MKFERQRVDAETAAGEGGAVVKHVSEMRMAVGAADFGAAHAVAVVGNHPDTAGNGGVKARPSAAAVEFLFGSKQRVAAAGADVGAFFVKLVIFAGKGRCLPMPAVVLVERCLC